MRPTAPMVLVGLVLAALGLIVLGCAGDEGQQGPSGDSPEAIFQTAKTAIEQKDYPKFAQCLTAESQEMMAGGLVFAGGMMKAFSAFGEPDAEQKQAIAKIDEVFKKHGLDPDKLQEENSPDPAAGPEEAFAQLSRQIDDKAAFIGEMMKALEGLGDEGQSPAPALAGELVDVKITDDKATANIVHKQAGEERRDPIEFRKVGDGWLIHMPMEQMQGGPEGSGAPPADPGR
jgi:hypothetical protein